MELIRNGSFTLTTGDSKPSRLRRLRNGVPQVSVLAPLLFNIYTNDVPSTTSKKFAYADDLAILHTSGEWKELERTLSQDMTTLSEYLQAWRLKLSHTKTVTAAFHLHNREAKREHEVCNIGKTLPFCPVPTYLGLNWADRSPVFLTWKHCARSYVVASHCWVDLLEQVGVLAPKHCAQLTCLWSTRLPSTAHQSGAAARTHVSSTVNWMTPCALSLDACVPLHRSAFRFFQASSQLSFAAKERHSP